jgi:hypothetical protein
VSRFALLIEQLAEYIIYKFYYSKNHGLELINNSWYLGNRMGDIDNGIVDRADWTPQLVAREVRRACEKNGKLHFVPCLAAGGPGSTFPGEYDAVSTEIDKMSKEMF